MSSSKANILWGVCGIGHGHTFRQLPLIEHFANEGHKIMIFAYGESFSVCSKRFKNTPNVKVETVAVPYYVGSPLGLDFEATASHPNNQNVDFQGINAKAFLEASDFIAKPDLVISDYEPVSAQYAYAKGAPLVTLDQQSKYLVGDFQKDLNRTGFQDEIERLRMFFPKAEKRLACSFFNVVKRLGAPEEVDICAPILRQEIIDLERKPSEKPSILVYLSAQMPTNQSLQDIAHVLKLFSNVDFYMFGQDDQHLSNSYADNIMFHQRDDQRFLNKLGSCHGIIATAGHSLLSEAMALSIPVFAMPLPLYEQQMNAQVIEQGGFGMSCERIDAVSLTAFLRNLPAYAAAIEHDEMKLLKSDGCAEIVSTMKNIIKLKQ